MGGNKDNVDDDIMIIIKDPGNCFHWWYKSNTPLDEMGGNKDNIGDDIMIIIKDRANH
jgi:hypothetical protein